MYSLKKSWEIDGGSTSVKEAMRGQDLVRGRKGVARYGFESRNHFWPLKEKQSPAVSLDSTGFFGDLMREQCPYISFEIKTRFLDNRSLKNICPAARDLSTSDVHCLTVHDSKTKAFANKLKIFWGIVVLELPDNIRNVTTKQKANIIAGLGMRRCKTGVTIVGKEETT